MRLYTSFLSVVFCIVFSLKNNLFLRETRDGLRAFSGADLSRARVEREIKWRRGQSSAKNTEWKRAVCSGHGKGDWYLLLASEDRLGLDHPCQASPTLLSCE